MTTLVPVSDATGNVTFIQPAGAEPINTVGKSGFKVDTATNWVLVQGTAAERRAVVDAAALVDADWMKQQSVGIQQVSMAMATINTGMNQTTRSAESLSTAAEEFNRLADRLSDLVRKYKL